MRPALFGVAATALAGAALFGWWLARPASPSAVPATTRSADSLARIVPDSVRIKVEVLNASGQRGVARRAMLYLRQLGFDVVSVGNAPARSESSTVVVRSGRADWGELAARAVGGARVEIRADSLQYLDLTLLLGAQFRTPPQHIYP
jgi:hypothetical protein